MQVQNKISISLQFLSYFADNVYVALDRPYLLSYLGQLYFCFPSCFLGYSFQRSCQ